MLLGKRRHSLIILFFHYCLLSPLTDLLAMEQEKQQATKIMVTGQEFPEKAAVGLHVLITNHFDGELTFIKTRGGTMPLSAYKIMVFYKRRGKFRKVDYSALLRSGDNVLYNSSDQIISVGPNEAFEEDLTVPLVGEVAKPGTYRIQLSRWASIGQRHFLVNSNELSVAVR